MKIKTLLTLLASVAASSQIVNTNVMRTVDLMEAGSNLNIF